MALNGNSIAPIGVGSNPLTNTVWERGLMNSGSIPPISQTVITTESGIPITTETGIELTTEP